jgi:hypothetical protein
MMTNSNIELSSLTEKTAKSAASLIEKFLASKGLTLGHAHALDLVGSLAGCADWRSLKASLNPGAGLPNGKPTPLTIEEFHKRFKPMKNTLDSNAAFEGFAFETYGPELEYVREMQKTHPERVWTVVEGDVSTWLTSGYHHVNRVFYVLTHVGTKDDVQYEIPYGHDESDKLFEISVFDNKGSDVNFKQRVYAESASDARERMTCEIDDEASQILEEGGEVYVIVEQVTD